ncbi:hypothetical protein [Botrimarina sp.]|uniref:hypothetical protein n=1 Tax=Botrimarina sp. TaxID=2795802 RepID=UPI0032EE58FE
MIPSQRIRSATLTGLVPLGLLAAPMIVGGWAWGGEVLAIGVSLAVVAAAAIALACDALVGLTGLRAPVERLLVAMGVRGTAAVAALLFVVHGLGVAPKVAVAIAMPLYLSLIAGEVLTALGLAKQPCELGAGPLAACRREGVC